MSRDIQIHIDPTDVERKLRKLENVKNGAPKAVMRAMNRTVTGMKTDAAKEISAGYTILQKDIKEKLEVEKASQSDLSIAMRSKGRPMRSIKFSHKANKKPGIKGGAAAYLRVKKSESGSLLNGKSPYSKAFMATMPNGMQGIFQRTGEKVRSIKARTGRSQSRFLRRTFSNKGRENIEQLYSPGAVQMLDTKETSKRIQTKATERFNKELDHQIEHLLSQQKG